ncbi:hypothetical protein MASR2M48_24720 [Spirochaetota bacterium]
MVYDDGTGPVVLDSTGIDQLKTDLAAASIVIPDISADGFMFSADNKNPVFRLYGGISLDLLFLSLDLQESYVPATKSLGASAMIRVGF